MEKVSLHYTSAVLEEEDSIDALFAEIDQNLSFSRSTLKF